MKNLNQSLNYRIPICFALVLATTLLTIAEGITIPIILAQDTSARMQN